MTIPSTESFRSAWHRAEHGIAGRREHRERLCVPELAKLLDDLHKCGVACKVPRPIVISRQIMLEAQSVCRSALDSLNFGFPGFLRTVQFLLYECLDAADHLSD